MLTKGQKRQIRKNARYVYEELEQFKDTSSEYAYVTFYHFLNKQVERLVVHREDFNETMKGIPFKKS